MPTPASVIGWEPGADRKLVDYDQTLEYFRALAEASDRVHLEEIGTTAMGRPMILAFISSADNVRRLERYRAIAERLATDASLPDDTARRMAREGRAVLWLDGGLHSTEVAGHQFPPVLAYRMATEESAEMQRIRDRVIVMLMPSLNPDGQDIVVDWYRRVVGTPYETAPLPTLYHEYVGHDNNRDWFMLTQPESRAVARQLWHRWFPQIVVNHHQESPFPGRIFIPPFADPVNPRIPSMVVTGINVVGTAMHQRFQEEDKSGAVSRIGFTQWWNGGMRTAPYFHNQVGILTEVAHEYATPRYYEPDSLPDRFSDGLPADRASTWYPDPWEGGWWRLSDAVDYMITASMGVAEVAARRKDKWLYNMHVLARRAVEQGREGDPYAYVFPTEQRDPVETVALLEVLRRGGIRIHRATEAFTAGGRRYAAGAHLAYTAQPFRAHLLDMMEPQEYPTRRESPGGEPITPYDLAGWTLPTQMGVEIRKITEPFEAATEELTATDLPMPDGGVAGAEGAETHLLSPTTNGSYPAVNALLDRGVWVGRADTSFSAAGRDWPAGTWLIRRADAGLIRELGERNGVTFTGVEAGAEPPRGARVRTPRIGLYRSWDPSMDEGWTRWIFDQYGFPFETLRDRDLREGDLASHDVIVLPHQSADEILRGHLEGTMPPEYTGGVGPRGTAALERWVRNGGTLVALDHAKEYVISQFGLPVRDPVADLPSREFFIPGSLVRLRVDPDDPLGYGVAEETSAYFVRSGALEVLPAASQGDLTVERTFDVAARYGDEDILLSGWEMGAAEHLAGEAAVVRLPVGEGQVVLFAFRPQFRGQPRATFKLFFNALYLAGMPDMPYGGSTDWSP